MADMTVTPTTLLLALDQQTSGYGFTVFPSTLQLASSLLSSSIIRGMIITPSTFQLESSLLSSSVRIFFPTWLSRKPSHRFSDEKSDEAVSMGNTASGYVVLNKVFTFDPRTFIVVFRLLTEADKLAIMAFYENYKDVLFFWYNHQDHVSYEVCFVNKPRCQIDGRVDLWRIGLVLRQNSRVA